MFLFETDADCYYFMTVTISFDFRQLWLMTYSFQMKMNVKLGKPINEEF